MQAALELSIEHLDDQCGDPDGDVLQLVAAGEVTTAVQRLMKRHGAQIYRYCRAMLQDGALADDVHQQIFIEVFRDLPRFGRRSPLRHWMLAIAHHRVIDAVRARRRNAARFDLAADTREVADLAPSVEARRDDSRLRDVLAGCLGELDPEIRTALLLRYQQGLSFDEMAEICGEQPGTLEARVRRALPRLRARIAQWMARRQS